MAIGEFNGDGKLDMVLTAGQQVYPFYGSGDGSLTISESIGSTPGDLSTLATGEFSDDGGGGRTGGNEGRTGGNELVTAAEDGIQLFLNNSGVLQPISLPVTGNFSSVTSGDINGDRLDDMVLTESSGRVTILLGNGDGTFQPAEEYAVGDSPRSVTLPDVNGDGAPDVGLLSSGGFNVFLNAGGTSVTLQSSLAAAVQQQPISFTATVAATVPGAGSPSGTVTFKDVSVFPIITLGTAELLNGTAQLTTGLPVGTHDIQAFYSGDTTFNPKASNQVSEVITGETSGGSGGKGGGEPLSCSVSSSSLASASSPTAAATAALAPRRSERTLGARGGGTISRPAVLLREFREGGGGWKTPHDPAFAVSVKETLDTAAEPIALPEPTTSPDPVSLPGPIALPDPVTEPAPTGAPDPTVAPDPLALPLTAEQRQDFRLGKPYLATSRATGAGQRQPRVPATAQVLGPGMVLGFDGLSHFGMRNADDGNQASLEPPDMGLAASDNQVVQIVNGALAVYSTEGLLLAGPSSLNLFFGLPHAVDRTVVPKQFGPFVADPRALYDPQLGRWYIVALKVATNPLSGAFLSSSSTLLAVSRGSDATGLFDFYEIDVTDDGYGDCPCIGDQPLLGMNREALFLSMNQFSFRTRQFQTALVLAIDKGQLLKKQRVRAVGFQNLTVEGEPAFSVYPAIPAPGTSTTPGVEFFLSTLNFSGAGDDRLAVWAMSDTRQVAYGSQGKVGIQSLVVNVDPYDKPTTSLQMSGPTPLLDELNAGLVCDGSGLFSQATNEVLEALDANDDRMQQVYQRGGELLAAFGTRVMVAGQEQMGVAWVRIGATSDGCSISATVNQQGQLGAAGQDLLFPALAVNAQGKGVVGFTVTGSNLMPGFGYAHLNAGGVENAVNLVVTGAAPEDGFSGYRRCGGRGVARWGDYSGAAVSPNGDLWTAGEYIPNATRTQLANWGSHVVRITPPCGPSR
ncbi:MAG TPA: FG-GAP-like repeat-containing protein [Terriglobales bacterium]|nr:FG-GAP-like repeat-containing protein [Terriglobales bacterium]